MFKFQAIQVHYGPIILVRTGDIERKLKGALRFSNLGILDHNSIFDPLESLARKFPWHETCHFGVWDLDWLLLSAAAAAKLTRSARRSRVTHHQVVANTNFTKTGVGADVQLSHGFSNKRPWRMVADIPRPAWSNRWLVEGLWRSKMPNGWWWMPNLVEFLWQPRPVLQPPFVLLELWEDPCFRVSQHFGGTIDQLQVQNFWWAGRWCSWFVSSTIALLYKRAQCPKIEHQLPFFTNGLGGGGQSFFLPQDQKIINVNVN